MYVPSRIQPGFTLVELLVVIGIIAILASILFPVLSRAQQKARESACLANIRQLAVAMTMYAQDNKYYPSAETWGANLLPYTQHNKGVFRCPADKDHGIGYCDYILSNAIVDTAGNGIAHEEMISAANVPVLYDGTAATIANALTLGIDATAALQDRHGVNAAYADGHVAAFGSRDLAAARANPEDMTNALNQGFYAANAFGWVKNPGLGGTPPTATASAGWTYGGSSTLAPLWEAVNAGWTAALAPAESTNHAGVFHSLDGSKHAVDAGNDLGGYAAEPGATFNPPGPATGVVPTAGPLVNTWYIVAMDAVAPVVSTATRLKTAYSKSVLHDLFVNGGYNPAYLQSACGAATLNLYTFHGDSGAYCFFAQCLGLSPADVLNADGEIVRNEELFLGGRENAAALPAGVTVTYVNSTREMLDAVAKDPFGLGFVSCGQADPDKVTCCDLQIAGGATQHYTRAAVESVKDGTDATATASTGWVMTHALCAIWHDGANTTAEKVLAYLGGSFQHSYIFKSTFFPPVPGWQHDGSNATW